MSCNKHTKERLGISSMSIKLSHEINIDNFEFLFKDYLDSLKYKMLKEIGIRQGIEGRYSISYREHKVTYFLCAKNNILMIIDCHKLSTEEYVLNMYR